jgi:hypothetical protein
MDPERDRLKHLLIILLEALSGPQEVMAPMRSRIQEKAEAAGLDEADVHGLLDWIEAQWLGDDRAGWGRDAPPDAPSDKAFRYFGDVDADYLSPRGLGFLVELFNNGQINRAQLEALLQYSSFIALKPLEPIELESVLEQVLFRPERPGMTGGASEGFENIH